MSGITCHGFVWKPKQELRNSEFQVVSALIPKPGGLSVITTPKHLWCREVVIRI